MYLQSVRQKKSNNQDFATTSTVPSYVGTVLLQEDFDVRLFTYWSTICETKKATESEVVPGLGLLLSREFYITTR